MRDFRRERDGRNGKMKKKEGQKRKKEKEKEKMGREIGNEERGENKKAGKEDDGK